MGFPGKRGFPSACMGGACLAVCMRAHALVPPRYVLIGGAIARQYLLILLYDGGGVYRLGICQPRYASGAIMFKACVPSLMPVGR